MSIKIPDKLFDIINQLKNINSAEFKDGLNQKLAEQELKNIEYRFDTTTDPSGAPWKPLKKQPQDHKTLDLTGTMKNSFEIKKGSVYSIINTTNYATFQNNGTKFIPARKFFSDRSLSTEENKLIYFNYMKNWILKRG